MAGGAGNLGNAGARLFDLSANAFFELLNVGKLNVWGWTLSSDTLRLYLWPQIGGLVLQALQGLLDPFSEPLVEYGAAFLFEFSQSGRQLLCGAANVLRHAAVTFLEEGIDLNLLNLLKGLFGGRGGSSFERLFGNALELKLERGNKRPGLKRNSFGGALAEASLQVFLGVLDQPRYLRSRQRFHRRGGLERRHQRQRPEIIFRNRTGRWHRPGGLSGRRSGFCRNGRRWHGCEAFRKRKPI